MRVYDEELTVGRVHDDVIDVIDRESVGQGTQCGDVCSEVRFHDCPPYWQTLYGVL